MLSTSTRTDSTNAVRSLKLAADGAEHGTVVVAEEQTRAGPRRLVLRKIQRHLHLHHLKATSFLAVAPVLTLMTGLAAQKAVSAVTALPVDIRWPNDLLINGKRILRNTAEMSAKG